MTRVKPFAVPHRRDVLRQIAYGIAAAPLLGACGSSDAGPDAPGSSGDTIAGSDWASGGTVSMTGKASYPDPFMTAATTCALVGSTTQGPCTTATDLVREDISEGLLGLPVRLALRMVDGGCNPLVGATVRIWHTNREGSYSGQTPNNGMCLKAGAYASQDFMRGVQTTDANGIVYFDTCYPGWYSGRAIHIHFQVKMGATSTVISQLFFPEDITAAIFASHPDYKSYGQPNATLATDTIFSGMAPAERSKLIFDVARMSDGAMLASKTVTVTS
jgi:hypothetical protein